MFRAGSVRPGPVRLDRIRPSFLSVDLLALPFQLHAGLGFYDLPSDARFSLRLHRGFIRVAIWRLRRWCGVSRIPRRLKERIRCFPTPVASLFSSTIYPIKVVPFFSCRDRRRASLPRCRPHRLRWDEKVMVEFLWIKFFWRLNLIVEALTIWIYWLSFWCLGCSFCLCLGMATRCRSVRRGWRAAVWSFDIQLPTCI